MEMEIYCDKCDKDTEHYYKSFVDDVVSSYSCPIAILDVWAICGTCDNRTHSGQGEIELYTE